MSPKSLSSKDDPSYQGDAQVSYLRLQQPLWTGGRLTSNQDKARVNLELAQANTADTQLQLALRVVQAYADWATAALTDCNTGMLVNEIPCTASASAMPCAIKTCAALPASELKLALPLAST